MTVEQAARDFFGWFNRHYPAPSTNPDHEWNRLGVALVNHQEEAQPAAAGPEVSGQEPMTFVDRCLKDAEELRDIAAHFDALGKKLNGDFLREVANRHEILAGAYRTSTVRYERESKEWIERGRTAEDKAAALKWLEEMRGGECRVGGGEQQ